jgi:hypothetical protein
MDSSYLTSLLIEILKLFGCADVTQGNDIVDPLKQPVTLVKMVVIYLSTPKLKDLPHDRHQQRDFTRKERQCRSRLLKKHLP